MEAVSCSIKSDMTEQDATVAARKGKGKKKRRRKAKGNLVAWSERLSGRAATSH